MRVVQAIFKKNLQEAHAAVLVGLDVETRDVQVKLIDVAASRCCSLLSLRRFFVSWAF